MRKININGIIYEYVINDTKVFIRNKDLKQRWEVLRSEIGENQPRPEDKFEGDYTYAEIREIYPNMRWYDCWVITPKRIREFILTKLEK